MPEKLPPRGTTVSQCLLPIVNSNDNLCRKLPYYPGLFNRLTIHKNDKEANTWTVICDLELSRFTAERIKSSAWWRPLMACRATTKNGTVFMDEVWAQTYGRGPLEKRAFHCENGVTLGDMVDIALGLASEQGVRGGYAIFRLLVDREGNDLEREIEGRRMFYL
jgi:hypothetical protein